MKRLVYFMQLCAAAVWAVWFAAAIDLVFDTCIFLACCK